MYMKTTKVSCKMTLKLIHWRELIFAFGKTLPYHLGMTLDHWQEDMAMSQNFQSLLKTCVYVYIYMYKYISNEFCDIQIISTQHKSGTWDISIINPCHLGQDDQLLGAPSGVVGAEAHPTGLPNRQRRLRRILLSFWHPWNPKKTAELMWMWKFHEIHHVFFCFASCIFLFLLRFTLKGNHLMDCFAVFGYQCSLWWYTMIYTDILHVLIVLAHIRSICQFVYSQRIIPIGNSVGCFKSRWLCRYAGVFFADALRVFNQGCSILL